MFQSDILDQHKIHYEIKRKKTKRITIRMLPNLKLVITIPMYTPESEIVQVIKAQEHWILDNRKQYVLQYPELMIQRQYKSGELYRYLGVEYTLQIFISQSERIVLDDQYMYMFVSIDTFEQKHKLMKKWLKAESNRVLSQLFCQTFESFHSHNTVMPQLNIRDCKSIWGSCHYKKRSITLNRKLIHLPIDLIRYVIFHELVHLHHPNHSRQYYLELNQYTGNYKIWKEKLKKYSIYYF